MEIPLDSHAQKWFRGNGFALPKWTGIKSLKQSDHASFQAAALSKAKKCKKNRVHLDLWAYRNDQAHK